jgi:intein/homing endonuclease
LDIPNRYYKTNGRIPGWKQFHTATSFAKFCYFIGLFIGDGFVNINKNSYDIYLSIGKDEYELASFYDDLIQELFDRKTIRVHKTKENTRRFTHKELAIWLNETFGKTAYKKRIPEWFKNLHGDYKLAFIQGYLDSDGSVFYDRGKVRVNFTSVNLELLEDIQDILFGLQIRNSIVVHQKPTKNSLLSYRINIARCDNLKMAFTPIYESRKQKVLRLSIPTDSSKSKIQF